MIPATAMAISDRPGSAQPTGQQQRQHHPDIDGEIAEIMRLSASTASDPVLATTLR